MRVLGVLMCAGAMVLTAACSAEVATSSTTIASADASAVPTSTAVASEVGDDPVAGQFETARFCDGLRNAIDDVERSFQASAPGELGVAFHRGLASELQGLADSLPAEAPNGVRELFEIAGGLQAAEGDSAEAADPLGAMREAVGALFARMQAIEVDPAEVWVADQCGIERVGILLRLVDDDRVSTVEGAATAD